jgi:glycosyltransferase involved in cell wall biosynthesis
MLTGRLGFEIEHSRRIIRLDYVPFAQLINLIRGAVATVFPSLYEGFGLPIVESMVCGTPVITSNVGAPREIAGDAALLVDPYDHREIKDAIAALVSNSALRSEKTGLGITQAKNYSSEQYRARLRMLYEKVTDRSNLLS